MKKILLLSVFVFGLLLSASGQDYLNYASGKHVTTSLGDNNASKITDGLLSGSVWMCYPIGAEQWVEIDLGALSKIFGAHIYFYAGNYTPLHNWKLQYHKDGKWLDIPGTENNRNYSARVEQRFTEPVETEKVRLITKNTMDFGISEIQLWGNDIPKMPYGVEEEAPKPYIADNHWVCVNQVAYNTNAPKGFTVPTAKDNMRFYVVEKETGKKCFSGKLKNGKGDFSKLRPEQDGKEYYIEVHDAKMGDAVSFPFVIGDRAIQKMSYKPALAFMNDVRSLVGTHPSCWGGTPWRDGTYYSYEMPSMILLYLTDKAFIDNVPVTLNWERDSAKVLSPDFKKTTDPNDRDAQTTLENYYTLLEKPKSMDVPDLVQDIRFAVGWYLLDPINLEAENDPAGEKMHAQTIEQFAYFLYAYPAMKEYISHDFYKKVLDATMRWWNRAGLFDVITTVGTGKGRECPGHSIMPNLFMYEVAKREHLDNPERFLDAARNQTAWIIEQADWSDPKYTKGQRMSEHKLVTGLTHYYLNYLEYAPDGLYEKLVELAENYVSLSDNMWDFRRFDLTDNWTIPGFNECGNVAGFPACALSLAMCLDNRPDLKDRLVELAYAHFDNLYGRNPLNAHTASNPDNGFEGVERGFPYRYRDDICARLEITRGSLSSLPGPEMYPFNPKGKNRWPEGWTAFNAAWNVSLAYLNIFEGHQDIGFLKTL